MGLKFRDASYQRRTWLSKRTVKDGEAMVLWSLGGKSKEIVGPARVVCKFATIQFLDRVTAGPFEFLRVERRSGAVEHLRGPQSLWINPVMHSKVDVMPATHLASPAEAIVVYVAKIGEQLKDDKKQEYANKRLERVVVRGPTVFCPAFGERVAKFCWTEGGRKREFESIRLNKTTLLTLEAPLTSNDGAAATVRMCLGVAVEDVEKMLDAGCEDLPKELEASLASDLVSLGRRVDSASLRNLRGLAELLEVGDHATLPLLTRRCSELGVVLKSVELRGSQPSAELAARWSASDDDARALTDANGALRLYATQLAEQEASDERKAKKAHSEHSFRLHDATRRRELEEIDSHAAIAADKRAHEARLEATVRRKEVQQLDFKLDLEKLANDLHASSLREQASMDRDLKKHDEQVRFLAKLKEEAGVDTANILKEAPNIKNNSQGGLDALLETLIQRKLAKVNIAPPSY